MEKPGVSAAPARWTGVLGLLTSAMIWGLSWWPLQQLRDWGLHPLWSTCLMFSAIVVVISVARPHAWRLLARRPALWLVLLVSGGTNTLFNLGVGTGDVVRVVLLFYLMPVWTVPLAWLVVREPVRPAALMRVVMATTGAVVVLWPASDAGLAWHLTDLLGLVAGFGFALNNVLLRRLRSLETEGLALAMFLGSAAMGALLAVLLQAPPPPAPAPGWIMLAVSMGLLFLLGNLGFQRGATLLPPNVSAVLMLTEVMWATGSAVTLGAGALQPRLLAGGALILASATLAALA